MVEPQNKEHLGSRAFVFYSEAGCPLVGVSNLYHSDYNWSYSWCPLYGGCPLVGISIIRGSTVKYAQ